MTNFFSKKITVSLLAMIMSVSISHASLEKTSSNNPAPATVVALPDLTLSHQAKAFVKKYPSTAHALQVDLYSANIALKVKNQSNYTDKEKHYSPRTIQALNNCHRNIYTTDTLSAIYQNEQKTLSIEEMTALEAFFGSDIGKRYEADKLKMVAQLKANGLDAYQSINPDEYLTETDKDYSKLMDFMGSDIAMKYLIAMGVDNIKNAYYQTQKCIAKIQP